MSVNLQEIFERIKSEADFIQKARLIHYLRKNQEVRIKEISQALGIQSSYVSHILRLLRLPAIVIDGYYAKVVSISHLFIIARLKTEEDMIDTYETVLARSLTAPQTEELVREKLYNISLHTDRLTKEEIKEFIQAMKDIDERINIKVIQSRIKSKIILDLSGDTQFTTMVLRKIIQNMKGNLPVVNKKEMVHELK